MSVQAITAAFALKLTSPTDKLVVLALANYADAEGQCWPASATLQADTSLGERAIRNALGALERVGLISREERRRGDGTRRTDLVTLLFLQPARRAASQPAQDAGSRNRLGNSEPQPAPDAGYQPARRAGPTTFEPSLRSEEAEASSSLSAREKPRASKRCPEGWEPKPQTLVVLAGEGFTPGEIDRALAMVRDHEFGKARADWDAVLRNWLRNEHPNRSRTPRHDHQPSRQARALAERYDNYAAHDAGADLASELRRRREFG